VLDFVILGILLSGLVIALVVFNKKALALTPRGRCLKARTAQEFLGFKDIRDNMLIIDDYRYRSVLEVQPINFFLKSAAEQQAIEVAFKSALDSLRYPIEIFIPSLRMDPDNNLAEMQVYLHQANPLLQAYGRDLIEFTRNWVARKSLLTKGFYIIISYDHLISSEKQVKPETIYQQASLELENRAFRLAEDLAACGLKAKVLGTPALTEFIFKVYNRERSTRVNIAAAQEDGFLSLYTTKQRGAGECHVG